ncbi:MAG: enoyl-CoA hydratase-related protein [Acidimicrobiia bacterium]
MTLHVDRHDRVTVLTLDEPERRNALTAGLVADIIAAFDTLEADPDTGAVVITGAAPAFCAGADLANLTALADTDRGGNDPAAVREIYDGFLRVLDSPLPTVAAVNGPAVGAGFNLALACEGRIAGTSARFDARFLTIGLHPGGGHTWLLERAVGPQAAAALVLFRERLDGVQAFEHGLAWRCVPDDELLDASVEFAARATSAPAELVAATKASLREAPWATSFDDHLAVELQRQVWSLRQGWLDVG